MLIHAYEKKQENGVLKQKEKEYKKLDIQKKKLYHISILEKNL